MVYDNHMLGGSAIRIAFVITVLALLFSGCVSETSPKSEIESENVQPLKTTFAPVSTITPEPENWMLVKYSATVADKVVNKYFTTETKWEYPEEGNVFLIISLDISNHGYSEIKVDWVDWKLSYSTKDNPNTFISADIAISALNHVDHEFKSAVIENNGYYTAQIPYEVPANWNQYRLTYTGTPQRIVKWQEVK
jgi:Domain of unknown function (DUF4352)